MSALLEKLLTPAWYQAQGQTIKANMSAYYKPLFRAGSITPLWHAMAFVSVVMYSATQLGYRQAHIIQPRRKIEKEAMKEYVEKHGDPFKH